MAYVERFGFPVPRVLSAGGPDLVLERLHGPTMVQALASRTLSMASGAQMLVELHTRLHALPAMSRASEDASVVHLDLHPENVILTPPRPSRHRLAQLQ